MPCSWCLASHWPHVTDISGSPPTGSRPRRGRWAPAYALLWSMVNFAFFCQHVTNSSYFTIVIGHSFTHSCHYQLTTHNYRYHLVPLSAFYPQITSGYASYHRSLKLPLGISLEILYRPNAFLLTQLTASKHQIRAFSNPPHFPLTTSSFYLNPAFANLHPLPICKHICYLQPSSRFNILHFISHLASWFNG